MSEFLFGAGPVIGWAVLGHFVWVVVAQRKFDPACWLIWPVMLLWPKEDS